MKKKYIIRLTSEEREEILEILHAPTTPITFRNRANVLLLSDESHGTPASQAEIAGRCGVKTLTVFNTVKSYAQTGLHATLHFKPRKRASNPRIVTGEKEARIVALACGASPEGRSRWTVRLLAEKVVELKIMETVSYETIRATLKKHNLNLT